MKEMDMLEMFSEISDDLIEEASPERKFSIRRKPVWRPCLAAACLLAAVSAGGVLGYRTLGMSERQVVRREAVASEVTGRKYSLGGSGSKDKDAAEYEAEGGEDITLSRDDDIKEKELIKQDTGHTGSVSEMKEVSRAVSELMKTEEFRAMTTEEKLESLCSRLEELAESGTENAPYSLIQKDSITVSADKAVISYRYANGNIALINLSENSEKRY